MQLKNLNNIHQGIQKLLLLKSLKNKESVDHLLMLLLFQQFLKENMLSKKIALEIKEVILNLPSKKEKLKEKKENK
jgi:hypothetical protein